MGGIRGVGEGGERGRGSISPPGGWSGRGEGSGSQELSRSPPRAPDAAGERGESSLSREMALGELLGQLPTWAHVSGGDRGLWSGRAGLGAGEVMP